MDKFWKLKKRVYHMKTSLQLYSQYDETLSISLV